MTLKLAIVGFRHNHIFDLYRRAQESEEIEIVATCEEDETARAEIQAQGIEITHTDYDDLLAHVECDAVATGDYFAKRGRILIKALSQGKHVIADKPLCTDLGELDEIERLARENDLKVGCMLDMRNKGPYIGLRNILRRGDIGEVLAISFNGQHPLLLGSRPHWYFEPGKHGGTINDIAIHAVDMIPWATGHSFMTVNAARCWNAMATDYPHFLDAAQMMLTLDNGAGVLGDVSYFTPDSFNYAFPFYWQVTVWGRSGFVQTAMNAREIALAINGETEVRYEPLPPGEPGGYLRAFLNDITGQTEPDALDTQQVIRSARTALLIQQAADTHQTLMPLD